MAYGTMSSDDGADVAVGNIKDACIVEAQAITPLDTFNKDEIAEGVTLAGFTTLSINVQAAYAAIEGLSTVPGGIPLGWGTPTEGTIAGIDLGAVGSIVSNPAHAPPGSVTVTNATVTSIDSGIAKVTIVTAPDSITVTPAGVVSFNAGA